MINRSVGAALYGYLGENPRTLGYETSLINGFNTGAVQTGRSSQLDRNLAFATRVFSEFGSAWGSGGLADLKNRKLRIIGDAEARYREDPVRMLRAVRLAAKLVSFQSPTRRRHRNARWFSQRSWSLS